MTNTHNIRSRQRAQHLNLPVVMPSLLQRLRTPYHGRPLAVHRMKHQLGPVGNSRVRMGLLTVPNPIQPGRGILATATSLHLFGRMPRPRYGRIFTVAKGHRSVLGAATTGPSRGQQPVGGGTRRPLSVGHAEAREDLWNIHTGKREMNSTLLTQ